MGSLLLYELEVVMCYLFVFLICNLVVVNSQHHDVVCDPKERLALLQFKNSFFQHTYIPCVEFVGGTLYETPAYYRTSTWIESTDCCSWDGVECDDEGELGHVVGLHLSCSLLQGTLHPNSTIFTLSHLKTFNLSYNYLYGSPFSPQFGTLTNLRILDLTNSYFEGEVPLQISHLSNLMSLHLSANQLFSFSNMVMDQLAHNLTNLKELALVGLNLSNITPSSFTNFSPSVVFLDLSGCLLSGLIPSNNWIYSLPNLKYLDLSYNNFSGFMRDFKSNSLEYLDLSYNHLQGEISKSIYRQLNLTHLRLLSTNLSGVLNLDMMSRIPNLSLLEISNNNKLSIFSTNYGSNSSLTFISLTSLNLEKIPYFLRNQKKLSYLYLSNNQIVGKIPEWFSELGGLWVVDLSHNFLSSGIEVLLAMPNLITVDLDSNLFNKLPVPMLLPSIMTNFRVSNNNVSGNIHPSICQATNLTYLDLSNNSLSGELPSCLSNITNLQTLILKTNNFSGFIPIPPPRIQNYIASENQFIGEIPLSICLSLDLQILSLSNNHMNGTIPPCLTNVTSLSVLDLKGNNFIGTIPTFFPTGCQLRSLNLNDNQIHGELTQLLLNCENLEVLDLGNNNITGYFPSWLKYSSSLQVLILRSNQFYGLIDNSFDEDSFVNLRIIDLSHNNFSGKLPSNFFKNMIAIQEVENQEPNSFLGDSYYKDSIVISLKGLEQKFERILLILKTIDLSSNDFNGEISEEIGMLRSLVGLNLSHNKLTGEIPTSFSNLSNLEWLDLSSNKLFGSIPSQLLALTFLSTLNLSQNQLSGPIPQGRQFDTFESSSYFGNLGLCGNPLPKCDAHQNDHKPKLLHEDEEDDSLEKGVWVKAVFIGYGCGIVFGVFIGYLVFHYGKPVWLVAIVDSKIAQKIQTSKKSGRPRKRNE